MYFVILFQKMLLPASKTEALFTMWNFHLAK